jgi:hypothetical protein
MSENKSTGAGKGDAPRPVSKKRWDENYDAINWNHKKKLKCDDCKQEKNDVEQTFCPFAEEIHNEKVAVKLCKDCYLNRCDEI